MNSVRVHGFGWQVLTAMLFARTTVWLALLPLAFARMEPALLDAAGRVAPANWIPAGVFAVATACSIGGAVHSGRGLPSSLLARLLPWLVPCVAVVAGRVTAWVFGWAAG